MLRLPCFPSLFFSSIVQLWVVLLVCLLLVSVSDVVRAEESVRQPDIRLLIDVSGSMKKNDPHNLRHPAVGLLVHLVPNGAKAGVWTFGQQVDVLVPHQVVNTQWRELAARQTAGIHSSALFTQIGKALEAATMDARSPNAQYDTHIILLTDGMVDVSKSTSENSAERKRIVEQIFPTLNQARYRVHAVALSEEADRPLMEQLAIATGGSFEVAHTANDLMKIFLRAFDQSVPQQRLSLTNNRFVVDESVQEFTALIFRQKRDDLTRLIGPDSAVMHSAKTPPSVRWLRTSEYDLITVPKPLAGPWHVIATMEPESRITVLSNLALKVKQLAHQAFIGERHSVEFVLQADGKTQVDPAFLALLTAHASLKSQADNQVVWEGSLAGNRANAKGIFKVELPPFANLGVFELTLTLDGKTFTRQVTHRFHVRDTFSAALEQRVNATGSTQWFLVVRGHGERVLPSQTQVVATGTNPHRRKWVKPVPQTQGAEWALPIAFNDEGEYVFTAQVSGTDNNLDSFSYRLPPMAHFHQDPWFEELEQENHALVSTETASFNPTTSVATSAMTDATSPSADSNQAVSNAQGAAQPETSIEDVRKVSDASSIPESSSEVPSQPMSPIGLAIAVGIGSAVGIMALAGGGYVLYRRRRNSKTDQEGRFSKGTNAANLAGASASGRKADAEPPMEDLVDEPIEMPSMDDMDALEAALVEQVMGEQSQATKEGFAAEIRRAQGLELGEDELDDAIATLMDELDGKPKDPELEEIADFGDLDDFSDPEDSSNR